MQLPALMDKQGQRRGKPWAVLCAPQDVLGLMVLQLQQFPFNHEAERSFLELMETI